jgi:subtilisin family serine protease
MMFASLLRIGVIFIPGSAFALDVIPAENPVKNKYIVTLDNSNVLSSSSLGDLIDEIIQGDEIGGQSHGSVDQVYDSTITGFAAELDEKGLQNVLNNTNVMSVEEDGYVQLDSVTWGLDRIDDEDLPLDKSYEPTFGKNGEGVTAYIIDTGVLPTHTEFEDRATQEYNSVGDGKNYDCHGHGTHVAGTVGSKNYGVANKAKLVGVKVLSCAGGGTWSGVIGGVNWVAKNAKKPATANMSLGGGKNTALNAAVKALVASGVSTVVAAGNNNGNACDKSPASEPDAITVGATTNTDARASFSNWGNCVDIFAPGQTITAPWIGSSNTVLRTISGTSMASPHVCGGAALYLGQNPNLTPTEIVNKMLEDSIADTITNVGSGSPNKFLYVAANQSPTVSPAPTRTKTASPTKAPIPSNAPTSCPNGTTEVDNYGCLPYTKRNGKRMVYLLNNRYGWQTSHEDIAQKCGGHLASFVSKEEQDKILTSSIRSTVWIGLMQKTPCSSEPKGCWYWSDGTPLSWLNWSPGEPNNSGGKEHSAEVRSWDKMWNDNSYNRSYQGIYLLPTCFTSIEGCYLYRAGSKPCSTVTCRGGKVPLEIMVDAGNHGDQNSVSMKVKTTDGTWRKRKAIYKKGFENNKMTKIDHCIRTDRCYKIAIKDNEGDGMTDGDGSYEIMIDGDTVKSSDFPTGSKETYEIGCS